MAIISNREEFARKYAIALQRRESYLEGRTFDDGMVDGEQVTWYIAGASEDMVERNGYSDIPSQNPTDTTVTAALQFWYGKEVITDRQLQDGQIGNDLINMIAARSAMVRKRKMDDILLTALDAANTQYNSGTAITLTDALAVDIESDLAENNVDADDEITFVLTPKAYAQIGRFEQVSSMDFGAANDPRAPKNVLRWGNMVFVKHTGLDGMGTATAKCFVFAKSCVGTARAVDSENVGIDEDEANFKVSIGYKVARTAKILQQGGVMEVIHDDTAAIAS